MSAGPSGSPLPKKLGLTGEIVFTVRHAPDGFAELLDADGGTGDAVWQQSLLAPIDVVIAFHTRRDLLVSEWPRLVEPLSPTGAVWIAWPKKTSGVPSDITEDVLRAELLPTGWVDDKVCAIDATWSGLRFVRRKELRRPKEAAQERTRAKRRR